jgi:hypothetical protein
MATVCEYCFIIAERLAKVTIIGIVQSVPKREMAALASFIVG